MTLESDAVISVAGLMALAARTAPKACGFDSVRIEVLTGKDLATLGKEMAAMGEVPGAEFFRINGGQVEKSDACVLIGVAGREAIGADCGGCGYPSCQEMRAAVKLAKKPSASYAGPNCVLKITDLGIAVGSAVKNCRDP